MNSTPKYKSIPTYTYTPSQGAPYADPIPSKVSSSGSSLIDDFYQTQANNNEVANTNMTLGNTPAATSTVTEKSGSNSSSNATSPTPVITSTTSTTTSVSDKIYQKAMNAIDTFDYSSSYYGGNLYNADWSKVNEDKYASDMTKLISTLKAAKSELEKEMSKYGNNIPTSLANQYDDLTKQLFYIEDSYISRRNRDEENAAKLQEYINENKITDLSNAKEIFEAAGLGREYNQLMSQRVYDDTMKSVNGKMTQTSAGDKSSLKAYEKTITLEELTKLLDDAEEYSKWLDKYGTDTEAARAEAYKNRQTELERNRSTYGQNAENLAQLGLTNSGYSDYLDGVGYAAYIAGLSEADNQKAMQDAEYARQYAQYLTEKEAEAKQQAMALYGSVMSGELTPDQAMQYAKFLGASDEDAQTIYDKANTAASTVTPSNTNAELNTMSTNVLSVMMENGYGVDTAIKMLYPDATADQITHIKQYVSDVEGAYKTETNKIKLETLKNNTTALSQQIAAGNADISGYVANYNSLLNNSDSDVVESGKAMLSESLKNDLLKLYEEGGLTKSQTILKSYIEKYFGDENDKTGLTTYNGKSDDEKDAFFQDVLDELYNDGNGVLNENDYNELKRPAFDAALENADSIQGIAEIAARLENGCYGTESAKNELEDILRNLLNVESVDGEFTYLWQRDSLLEKSTVVPVPDAAMGYSVSGEVSTTSGLKFAVWFNLEKNPPSEILNTATNNDGNQIVYYNGELYCVSTSQKYNKQYVFKATALNKELTAPEKNAITKIFPVKEVRITFK